MAAYGKGRHSWQHSKQDLLRQFNKRKNVRWDLVDLMENSKARVITFKYGKKKWKATEPDGLISSTYNDNQYSMHGCNLKPGDIILWGECNWYCTYGKREIVCMEKYLKNTMEQQQPFHYERTVACKELSEDADKLTQVNKMESNRTGSQFCPTQSDIIEPETKANMEYDEDLVEFIPDTVKFFVNRELKDIQSIEWAYLNKPLREGDVINGPNGESQKDKSIWVVSKSMVLRRTYNNNVNRYDIKLRSGEIFQVGDNLHYATHYMSMFVCVSSYKSPNQVISDIKARNKKRAKQESTVTNASNDV